MGRQQQEFQRAERVRREARALELDREEKELVAEEERQRQNRDLKQRQWDAALLEQERRDAQERDLRRDRDDLERSEMLRVRRLALEEGRYGLQPPRASSRGGQQRPAG